VLGGDQVNVGLERRRFLALVGRLEHPAQSEDDAVAPVFGQLEAVSDRDYVKGLDCPRAHAPDK
jgi:hypothetical protein